ncbi:MAG TPA: caspase family protein [Bacteroidia bacterium]|nr:caspase family protein [Bacteroidia bacterium]
MRLPFYSLLLLLAFSVFGRLAAQDVSELKYTGSDGTVYTGLLVYTNEEESFMRIQFTQNGKYRVVHTDYAAVTGEEEGQSFFFLVGTNAHYITESDGSEYNPDHFIWIWEEDGNYDLPYTSDNPEYDMSEAIQVTSYKQLQKGKVTEAYLKSYFGTSEPEYISLRKFFGLEKSTTPVAPTVADGKATIHLMVIANTAIGDIGSSCTIDKRNLVSEFKGIAEATGMGYKQYVLEEQQFTKANLLSTMNSFKPGSNDVLVFVYRGHGFRWSNQTETYPQLDLRYSSFTRISEATSINLEDVYNTIVAKGARLNLFFADCCNSDVGISQMTSASFMNMQANNNYDTQKLRKLFLGSKGSLISTSASPGEVSWANNANGGFFTVSFLQALRDEISYLHQDEADWEGLIQNTIKGARYKSSKGVCSNCTVQNGIYYSDVTYGK